MKLGLKFLSPVRSRGAWRFLVLGCISAGLLRLHSHCFLAMCAGQRPASVDTRSPSQVAPSGVQEAGGTWRAGAEGVPARVGPTSAWAWEEEPRGLPAGFHCGKMRFGK